MSRIAVIGAGSWGTALALSLERARTGAAAHQVRLWAHSPAVTEAILSTGENTAFLPGIPIPHCILATSDLAAALDGAEIVVTVMPSHHVRPVYEAMARYLTPNQLLVSATKGIEERGIEERRIEEGAVGDGRREPGTAGHTYLRVSEIISQTLAAHCLHLDLAVLSGPSFAREVAAGAPTAITIASTDAALARHVQREFSGPTLRLYTNDDPTGVELGGALKNVIALAAGVVAGLGLGHNASAALITRGIAEITRLAVACGGKAETLAGLAGLGDLVLTCTGELSRNRHVGIELGRGRTLAEILDGLGGKVAEGVRTTPAALGLARLTGVEMPITEQVSAVLYDHRDPMAAMRELMSRPGRDE